MKKIATKLKPGWRSGIDQRKTYWGGGGSGLNLCPVISFLLTYKKFLSVFRAVNTTWELKGGLSMLNTILALVSNFSALFAKTIGPGDDSNPAFETK